MSKSLRSFPEKEREAVAANRISCGENGQGGLGYQAALDYFEKMHNKNMRTEKKN